MKGWRSWYTRDHDSAEWPEWPFGEKSTQLVTLRNLTFRQLNVTFQCIRDFRSERLNKVRLSDFPCQGWVKAEPYSTNSVRIISTEDLRDERETLQTTTDIDVGLWVSEIGTRCAMSIAAGSAIAAGILFTIYHEDTRTVTLFEKPDASCWMKDFRDDTSIAALSIPGTHNSPTCHWALPSVRCQAVSPLEQLNNGVRFFDVRVQPAQVHNPSNETLHLVHGAFPISLVGYKSFRELVDTIESFLQTHPSETLILSVKREGISRASDEQLAEILATHYAAHWYTDPDIPTLGQVRGKIVLMRRFGISDQFRKEHDGHDWALDAGSWEDNTVSCVHGQVCVQDFYGVRDTSFIPKKVEVSCAQLERAAAVICPVAGVTATQPPQVVYLNFLTASNFFNFKCWPEQIAKRLNPDILAFLCQKHDCGTTGTDGKPSSGGDGGLGIVVCDWVGKDGNWDLVRCIIGMNSRRLYRERGHGWT